MLATDTTIATALVRRWVDPTLTVTAARPLRGGMVHQVCRWDTDGDPPTLVAKLNSLKHAATFRDERAHLQWYRDHSELPVPQPMTAFEDEAHDIGGLLMEHIPACNLAQARLSPEGMRRLQHELAEHIAALAHPSTRNLRPGTGRSTRPLPLARRFCAEHAARI